MISGLAFHHHGLAVSDDGAALVFLQGVGYSLGERCHDPLQDVYLRLCTHVVMPAVEIVMPGIQPGPLTAMLKQQSQLIYHTCYETDDLQGVLDGWENSGLRVFQTLPPTPAVLFGGRRVSFYMIGGVGLVELLEKS